MNISAVWQQLSNIVIQVFVYKYVTTTAAMDLTKWINGKNMNYCSVLYNYTVLQDWRHGNITIEYSYYFSINVMTGITPWQFK